MSKLMGMHSVIQSIVVIGAGVEGVLCHIVSQTKPRRAHPVQTQETLPCMLGLHGLLFLRHSIEKHPCCLEHGGHLRCNCLARKKLFDTLRAGAIGSVNAASVSGTMREKYLYKQKSCL